MCLGLEQSELEDLGLVEPNSDDLCDMSKNFSYTRESDCVKIPGVDDVDEFFKTQEWLELFNIKDEL